MGKLSVLLGLTFVTAPLLAQPRSVLPPLEAAAFDALKVSQLNENSIYYTQKVLPFPEWAARFPNERSALALFPDYDQPKVPPKKKGLGKKDKVTLELMVFLSRSKLVIKKAPGQIALQSLVSMEAVKKFDSEIQHVSIQQNQFMSSVAGKGQITNFQWCNKDGQRILRPAREMDLSYTIPKNRNWCSDSAHSICVESCYLFNKYWTEGVKLANLAFDANEKKDTGIAMQSELRVYQSESDLGLPVPLKSLTGMDTPVRGVLEQNMFYFNQAFEFGKVLAVIQEIPGEPEKSAVTVFFTVGIKKHTYDMFSDVRDVILGESTGLFNTKTGITAGLPVFTQNTVKSISTMLEGR